MAAVALASAGGCAFVQKDKIHYVIKDGAAPSCEACAPLAPGENFVGLALSGGGARAAVFAAAAIEILAEQDLMDEVTHVSSVSGGGFAASYYALRKPRICTPSESTAGCPDFAAFKEMMRRNFLNSLLVRFAVSPRRATSPTRRLVSLADALDDAFIEEATFADLPPAPTLLVNAARYDDARRFVFSNATIPEAASAIPPFTEDIFRSASFSLPDCPRATPSDFPLALAVAISAGFPPILGPGAIAAPERCAGGAPNYWHLGDGGILENTGVETLEDFALNAAPERRPKRAIIFSVDAGRSTPADQMFRQRNLKLWTSDPGRVVDILYQRAAAYRARAIASDFANAPVEFRVLAMRYTEAELAAWPASCGAREGGAAAIRAALFAIPTSFRISDCDADLVEAAARDVVTRVLNEHRALLDSLESEPAAALAGASS